MRILSWNIQWGRGADGRVALERTIEVIRQAGPPELICLQEVGCNLIGMPGGDCADQPAALAAAFPGWTPIYAPAVDVPDGRGGRALFGNLVLSRLPVGAVCRHVLPMPVDASVPGMRRGCIEVVIDCGRRPIRVLTTHLEYYSAVQRAAQVAALRALQQEAAGTNGARRTRRRDANPVFAPRPRPVEAVLCGDFNFEPGSPGYRALSAPLSPAQASWQDAWTTLHGATPHAPTVGVHKAEWPDRPYCCDYFWLSGALVGRAHALQVLADTDASDHQPLLLTLDTPRA